MTKNEYLNELRKELKLNNANDIEDIIAEYDGHFEFKMEEGLTEEEIAKKLSSPKEIAKEYASDKNNNDAFNKGLRVSFLSAVSIPMGAIYALIWCSVVVLAGFAISCATLGVCLITTTNIAGLIPYIPYFPALVLGIACLGLAILSAIGTYYMFMYVCRWGKIYIRWCKNVANNSRYPSISKHPQISKKVSSKLKLIAIVGLVCFVSAFVLGYVLMCIASKSIQPWHVWNWFN